MSKAMLSEAMIQGAILEYLAARHVFAIRMNSGTQIIKDGSHRRVIRLHDPGTADILAFPRPITWEDQGLTPLWLEVKSETGKQSPIQKSFQHQVEEEGHVYRLVRSIEDVKSVLEELA